MTKHRREDIAKIGIYPRNQEYKKGKLTSRTSDWYIHIYMDDFEDYNAIKEEVLKGLE